MIRLLGRLEKNLNIAFSGGSDSVFASHFAKRNRNITLYYFNHGTSSSSDSEEFAKDYASKFKFQLNIGGISRKKLSNESWEEFWRNERYSWLRSFNNKIATCHHLSDQIETWIFSSAHGNPKLIPYLNKNIIRPFLMVPKKDIISYLNDKNLSYHKDPSNDDEKYMRNIIRKNIVSEFYKINPGIEKVIIKKIISQNFPLI